MIKQSRNFRKLLAASGYEPPKEIRRCVCYGFPTKNLINWLKPEIEKRKDKLIILKRENTTGTYIELDKSKFKLFGCWVPTGLKVYCNVG